MSCFTGRMKEYRNISIDRFDGYNLSSTAFFLSHCHSDHMVGLESNLFVYALTSQPCTYLYCSLITKQLLMNMKKYREIIPYVRNLPLETPTLIKVLDKKTQTTQNVSVTLIEAHHCPGSVMFLFEGNEGTSLYTGDFRYDRHQISAIGHLHHSETGELKTISSLYIDTTFCIPEATFIATRAQTIDAVLSLTEKWIQDNPNNLVVLRGKARLGYEFLFAEIHQNFKMKVHVSDSKQDMYSEINVITDHVTTDSSNTRIHACEADNVCCKPYLDGNILVMVLSTMWFTQCVNSFKSIIVVCEGQHRVCCSMHASYQEIKDTVCYLQPHNVYANVKPRGYDINWVENQLQKFETSSLNRNVFLGAQKKRKHMQLYGSEYCSYNDLVSGNSQYSTSTGSDQDSDSEFELFDEEEGTSTNLICYVSDDEQAEKHSPSFETQIKDETRHDDQVSRITVNKTAFYQEASINQRDFLAKQCSSYSESTVTCAQQCSDDIKQVHKNFTEPEIIDLTKNSDSSGHRLECSETQDFTMLSPGSKKPSYNDVAQLHLQYANNSCIKWEKQCQF